MKRALATFTRMSPSHGTQAYLKVSKRYGSEDYPSRFDVTLTWMDTLASGRPWKTVDATIVGEGTVANVAAELGRREVPEDGRGYFVHCDHRVDAIRGCTVIIISFLRFLDIIDPRTGQPVRLEDLAA